MLLLSRHTEEQIIIGGEIVITVVEIGHDKVRLGIEAPQDVRVDRMEIHELRARNDWTDTDKELP